MGGGPLRTVLLPTAVFLALLVAWEGAVVLLRVQQIVLPRPTAVAVTEWRSPRR